jgi:hypothetical protein
MGTFTKNNIGGKIMNYELFKKEIIKIVKENAPGLKITIKKDSSHEENLTLENDTYRSLFNLTELYEKLNSSELSADMLSHKFSGILNALTNDMLNKDKISSDFNEVKNKIRFTLFPSLENVPPLASIDILDLKAVFSIPSDVSTANTLYNYAVSKQSQERWNISDLELLALAKENINIQLPFDIVSIGTEPEFFLTKTFKRIIQTIPDRITDEFLPFLSFLMMSAKDLHWELYSILNNEYIYGPCILAFPELIKAFAKNCNGTYMGLFTIELHGMFMVSTNDRSSLLMLKDTVKRLRLLTNENELSDNVYVYNSSTDQLSILL